MSHLPRFAYALLWEERELVSVANLTRADGIEFLRLAPTVGIVTWTTRYSLEHPNEAPAICARGVRGCRRARPLMRSMASA